MTARGTKRRMVSIDPSKLTAVKRNNMTNTKKPKQEHTPFKTTSHELSLQHQRTTSLSSIPNGALWADQFSPSEPSQLAIHPKKLSTVHAWLIDALHGAPHTRKYRRVLILAGPAGCGKSTIIHSLAYQKHHQVPPTGSSAPSTSSHIPSVKSTSKTSPTPPIEGIGYEILEWKNTGNESSVSKPQEFGLWLMRASAGPTLSFDDDEPINMPLPSSSHHDPYAGPRQPKRPTVLLVDDLPNLHHGETGRIFNNVIRQHLNTQRPSTPPLVIIISDTNVTPGENGLEDSLAGRPMYSFGANSGEERGMNVHTLLPVDILQHPAACLVKLLPVNNTLMKKMLTRISHSISTASKPSPKDIQLIADCSGGDLRAALNNLQLFFTVPSSKIHSTSKLKKTLPSTSSSSLFNRHLLSSRDESLVIFHSLGKILYNKRWGDDVKEDAKDQRPRAPKVDPLPAFWAAYDRRGMKTDIDRLYSDLSVSVEQFVVYLHHNYPPFTDSIDEASFMLEYLSVSDATTALKDQSRYSQASTTGFYQFHMAARAMLLGLPSPVTRRNQKFHKPALWGHLRLLNENAALADSARSQPGLLSCLRPQNARMSSSQADAGRDHLHMHPAAPFDGASVLNSPKKLLALEVLPFLGLISSSLGQRGSDDNAELLDRFSTFVYPNTPDAQADTLLSEDEVPELDPGLGCSLPRSPSPPPIPHDTPLDAPIPQELALQEPLDDDLWFIDEDDIVD
ncbi:hypothetical protein PCASD_01694 [Puccinia coronata f. sp. avenae]|uniref:Checkpoint protein RAD24-like helical bundle domain-containing protein n=1 Tax=Puccinia coronata f. sp. avenae TaxID=200324 RepID=A0A2N5VK25_9BASI|nr:hypothetical protein PCASD_01694 [Puccinia coronata f. sp. avenae]